MLNFDIFFVVTLNNSRVTGDLWHHDAHVTSLQWMIYVSHDPISLYFPGTPSQVCRPHFHTPLHPWALSDTKPVVPHAHSSWPAISPFSKSGSSLSHPGSANPLATVHPPSSLASGVSSNSQLFSFPPTPPKDSTPEISGANGGQGSAQAPSGVTSGSGSAMGVSPGSHTGASAHSEYTPESKPVKLDGSVPSSLGCSSDASSYNVPLSMASSMSSSLSSGFGQSSMAMGMGTAHPMPTYPYMTGPDYTSQLFHPANVFKAATLARVRTKSRSSSGRRGFVPYFLLSYASLLYFYVSIMLDCHVKTCSNVFDMHQVPDGNHANRACGPVLQQINGLQSQHIGVYVPVQKNPGFPMNGK